MLLSKSILVIGSSNTDMVIKADRFPLPGETILGGKFFMFPGGKGANQAVAACRLGGNVTLITKIGNDIFGKQAVQQFRKEGINTEYIISDAENPSGVALITVDAKGENSIVVASGANGALIPQELSKAESEFDRSAILLMQLEIPLSTAMHAAALAAGKGKKVILNPAPAMPLPKQLFNNLYIITPNRAETEALTGVELTSKHTLESAAQKLKEKGVANVVITLGSEGAYICNDSQSKLIYAPKVEAIDTTAAGDVFNGALAVAIAEDASLEDAVKFANAAAAISVTKMGAQASAPYRNEISTLAL